MARAKSVVDTARGAGESGGQVTAAPNTRLVDQATLAFRISNELTFDGCLRRVARICCG